MLKKFTLPLLLIALLFLALGLAIPKDMSAALGNALGRDTLILLLFAWKPLFGALFSFGMAIGSNEVIDQGLGVKIYIGLLSCTAYYLAAMVVLGRGKILKSFTQQKKASYTISYICVAIAAFAILTTAARIFQLTTISQAESSWEAFTSLYPSIVNLLLLQTYVGFMLSASAMILRKYKVFDARQIPLSKSRRIGAFFENLLCTDLFMKRAIPFLLLGAVFSLGIYAWGQDARQQKANREAQEIALLELKHNNPARYAEALEAGMIIGHSNEFDAEAIAYFINNKMAVEDWLSIRNAVSASELNNYYLGGTKLLEK